MYFAFTAILFGLAGYALLGLLFNFAVMVGWVVWAFWAPIDWVLNRPLPIQPRRAR